MSSKFTNLGRQVWMFVALLSFGLPSIVFGQSVLRFDGQNGSASGDGTNWGSSAFKYLKGAIDDSSNHTPPVQIWVRGSTGSGIMCRPDQSADNPTGTPLNRAAFFDMKANVKIYGGFAGTEGPSDFNLRNPAANITILTGDIGTQNTTTDNCFTVVKCTASSATNFNCILDGVTITGGFANDGAGQDSGGGVRITNGAAPRLHQCRIANNFAGNSTNLYSGGAGVYVNAASPVLTRCTIEFNAGAANFVGRGGGLLSTGASTVRMIDCTIHKNSKVL